MTMDVALVSSVFFGSSCGWDKQTNKNLRCGCTKAARSKRPNTPSAGLAVSSSISAVIQLGRLCQGMMNWARDKPAVSIDSIWQ